MLIKQQEKGGESRISPLYFEREVTNFLKEGNDMKKVLMVLIIAAFCIAMAGIAFAAEAVKPATTMQQVIKPGTIQPGMLFTCPVGWTKKANVLACVPSKPAPITCPKGYQYYEKLTCTASTFFGGCQSEGCEIGCFQPPAPPK